jgi:hypothetical protein
MTQRAENVVLRPGTCRFCGCTESHACIFPDPDSDNPRDPNLLTCWWIDPAKTVCSNPHCVAQMPIEELERVSLGSFAPPKRKAAGAC